MSMRTPLEVGLGTYMGQFYAQLVADTPAMEEYVVRGLFKSIVWVPGRMVDDVQGMLDEWRKNDNHRDGGRPTGAPGLSSFLPVMLVGMAKDFSPSPPDWGVPVGGAIEIGSPADPHARMYKLRTMTSDYRAQVVIIAPEAHTAHSLALQFNLWANSAGGRRFKHWHEHAGIQHDFPAMLDEIDLGAVDAKVEQKNLTILLIDLNIRATIPVFQSPKAGEDNDGRAAPAGYPVVVQVDGLNRDGVAWTAK